MKKLYIGNLPFTATEDKLRRRFGQHGTVHSVALINDRETGRPRGFGFIEMDDDAISGVIQALDGRELGGRALRVNQAEDKRAEMPAEAWSAQRRRLAALAPGQVGARIAPYRTTCIFTRATPSSVTSRPR